MATTRLLRRLRRRLIIAGVLLSACAASAAPAAQAYPSGLTPAHAAVAHTSAAVRPVVQRVTVTNPSGFSWSDAGIGAALATITLVVLGGAVQTTRTRRHLPAQHA